VTLHTAEVQYYSAYGRFATSLQELGPPASGADTASAAGLIERDLAGGEKDGCRFTLTATPAGYAISAAPDNTASVATGPIFQISRWESMFITDQNPRQSTIRCKVKPRPGRTTMRRLICFGVVLVGCDVATGIGTIGSQPDRARPRQRRKRRVPVQNDRNALGLRDFSCAGSVRLKWQEIIFFRRPVNGPRLGFGPAYDYATAARSLVLRTV
jgi:hypothetical protein